MFYFKLLATDNLPFSLSNTSTSTARPYLSILPLTVLAIGFLLFSYLSPIIYVYTMGFVRSTIKLLHVLLTVSFSNTRLSNFQNVNFFLLAVNLYYFRKQFHSSLTECIKTFTQIITDRFNNLNNVHLKPRIIKDYPRLKMMDNNLLSVVFWGCIIQSYLLDLAARAIWIIRNYLFFKIDR